MFKFNLTNIQENFMKMNIEDKASLWHLRFGHLHYGGLRDFARKDMVHGLPNMDYTGKFCEDAYLAHM